MPSQENLELWSSMLRTAQADRLKKGLERDPVIDEQLDEWDREIERLKALENA